MTTIPEFLDLHAARLDETLRYRRLSTLEAYARGRQYDDRPLDVHGFRKGSPGVYGSSVRTPGWNERDPGAVWNLLGEIVGEITNWTLAGDAWCHLEVSGDEAAEDWLSTVSALCNLPDVVAQARDYGGRQGTAVVSFGVRNGDFFVEAHSPKDCWVLEWADEFAHVPAVVVKVYRGDDPLAKSERDLPLIARAWTLTDEVEFLRVKDAQTGEWSWRQTASAAHNLGFCPVVWHPQCTEDGRHDGTPDAAGCEESVDDANELFAAAACTTKRNADDTLVVKTSPANNPGNTRKGAFNTLYAEGGAEYLSQDGASAKICLEVAEKRAEQVYRAAGVVMLTLEHLGKATSGETLKRLYQRTIKTSGKMRRDYARGLIAPLGRMILQASRALLAQGLTLNVPPRVHPPSADGVVPAIIEPRTPGKSLFVSPQWPDPFPPTAADNLALMQTLVAGKTAGILSQRTAVEALRMSSLPVTSVDEELEALEADADAAAERSAKALGLGPEPPGKAGPVGGEEPDEGDDQAAAAE